MKNITITTDNMSELTENTFMDCLFKENENISIERCCQNQFRQEGI